MVGLRIVGVGLTLLMISGLSGCGGGSAVAPVPVGGMVTLDGSPLTGAKVEFRLVEGQAGQSASGVTGDDGSFRLTTRNTGDGAPPGKYIVLVTKPKGDDSAGNTPIKPGDPAYFSKMKDHMASGKTGRPPQAADELHPNYRDPKKTPLRFEIPAGGKEDLQIKLTKAGS